MIYSLPARQPATTKRTITLMADVTKVETMRLFLAFSEDSSQVSDQSKHMTSMHDYFKKRRRNTHCLVVQLEIPQPPTKQQTSIASGEPHKTKSKLKTDYKIT